MRILCVCDEGISRSPTIAALLFDHETIAVGAGRSSTETRSMLARWCDRAILTSPDQRHKFPDLADDKIMVWPIGDHYPRPFNPKLREIVRRFISQEGL